MSIAHSASKSLTSQTKTSNLARVVIRCVHPASRLSTLVLIFTSVFAPLADQIPDRYANFASTVSKLPTRRVPVQIAVESMMRKQYSTKYQQRRNSSLTSRTRIRSKLRPSEKRPRSVKLKPPTDATWLVSESNSKTLSTLLDWFLR